MSPISQFSFFGWDFSTASYSKTALVFSLLNKKSKNCPFPGLIFGFMSSTKSTNIFDKFPRYWDILYLKCPGTNQNEIQALIDKKGVCVGNPRYILLQIAKIYSLNLPNH